MLTKDGKLISFPQEYYTNEMDTEMAYLLTINDEDSSCPSSRNNNEKMPGYYYSSNGEGPSSYLRRDSGASRVGILHGDSGNFGSFQSQSHVDYHSQHGNFGTSPPPRSPTNFASDPFGASPPVLLNASRGRADSNLTSQRRVLLSAVSPGPVWPTANQLEVAYSYGIRRDDGTFTRLIRADRLPSQFAHLNIPERQGPEGLIIVPEPRQPSPTRRTGPMPLVPADVVASLPIYSSKHPQFSAPASSGTTQFNIDAIVNQSSSLCPTITRPYIPRREKIFCDKWIHEGVCAFTQMGCKYRHEMPLDKATQLSLGLNHGLPAWYKRALAVNLHPTGALFNSPLGAGAGPLTMTPSSARIASNWRRTGDPPANPGASSVSASHGLRGFGPIAPLPPAAKLKLEEGELEEQEDDNEVTYRG